MLTARLGVLQFGDFEVFADLAGEEVVDLAVSRNSRGLALRPIDLDGVFAALSMKRAAVLLEVFDQISPLHCSAITIGSRMTSSP